MIRSRFYVTCLFSFIAHFNYAQYTAGDRYQKPVFSNYDSIINVKYGSNTSASSPIVEDLFLDIYMPKDDALTKRPVIFFSHGGSFLFGSKQDQDVVHLCREFAKRGYVTVSQNYRLGLESIDAIGSKRAVWRAMQDGRAAVRFMRSKASEYKLDTNMFIYGGSSAGGFIALQLAFLDKPSELPTGIDTSSTTGIDGFEGKTNSLSNSSKVNAVINLCGAIGDTLWIEPQDNNVLVMSMHGNIDATVPYGTGTIKIAGNIPLLSVSGSKSIRERLNHLGFENRFYTYCGKDHVPYAYNNASGWEYMNTTITFINQFLYENVLKCGIAEVRIDDVDYADCALTGMPINSNEFKCRLYPNPGSYSTTMQIDYPISGKIELQIFDQLGKLIKQTTLEQMENELDVSYLNTGVYLFRFSDFEEKKYSTQFFIKE